MSDWRAHKLFCKSLPFPPPPPPSVVSADATGGHVQAVLLDASSDAPTLVQVPVIAGNDDGGGKESTTLDIDSFFVSNSNKRQRLFMQTNPLKGSACIFFNLAEFKN